MLLLLPVIETEEPPSASLQIDGVVLAVLVELCAPDLVHRLMLGRPEADPRSEPHVEIAHALQRVQHALAVGGDHLVVRVGGEEHVKRHPERSGVLGADEGCDVSERPGFTHG